MDTHATPTPRRRIVSRLKWVALILTSVCLLVVAITYLVNSSRVAAAQRKLRAPEVATRVAAVKELGALEGRANSAIPDLLDRLRNDESEEVQNAVVEVLWKIGPDTGAGLVWLRSRLDDPDASVRLHAAFILGCDRPSQLLDYVKLRRPWVQAAVAELTTAAKDSDPLVRWMAVAGIMRNAGPYADGAVPVLIEALGSGSEHLRRNTIIALGRIGPAARPAVRALAAEVKRPFPQVEKGADNREATRASFRLDMDRLFAATALGNIGEPAIPELMALLRDPNKGVRDAALMAFPRVGVAAAPALLELLRDSDGVARQNAARALRGYRGDPVAVALAAALKDEDVEVRRNAAQSLSVAGADNDVGAPALAAALKDADKHVVWNATFSLSQLGPRAKPAVPALVELALDETRPEYLRANAADVAMTLDPGAKSALPSHVIELAKSYKETGDNIDILNGVADTGSDINPLYR